MGLLSALGGLGGSALGGSGGMESGMFGLLPMLMQQKQKLGEGITPKPTPSFGSQLVNGLSNPMFSNGVQMMATGEAPGMGPMSNNEFGNAFANSPQFMQQLQAMQNGMGPGRQMPQFTPPPMQMSTAPMGRSPNGRNSTIPADLGLRGLGMLRGSAF